MKKLRIWMVITLVVGAMSIYYQRSKCGTRVVPVANAENVAARLQDFNTPNLQAAERTLQQMHGALQPLVHAENYGQGAAVVQHRYDALQQEFPRLYAQLQGWGPEQSSRLRDRGFVYRCARHTQWDRNDCIQLLENAAAIRCARDFEACTHDDWYTRRATSEWAETLAEHMEGVCPRSMTGKGMCVVAGKDCALHARRAAREARAIASKVRAIENAALRVAQIHHIHTAWCQSP